MKTKIRYLTVIIICVVASTLLFFAKAFCEDDSSLIDALYINEDTSHYDQMPENFMLQSGILYEQASKLNSFLSIIAFLQQKEKSPPLF